MFAHTNIKVHPTRPVNKILAGEQNTHNQRVCDVTFYSGCRDTASSVHSNICFVCFFLKSNKLNFVSSRSSEILINFNCYSPKDFISMLIYLVVHVQHEEVWVSGRI